jgi:hypothetical protein
MNSSILSNPHVAENLIAFNFNFNHLSTVIVELVRMYNLQNERIAVMEKELKSLNVDTKFGEMEKLKHEMTDQQKQVQQLMVMLAQ